MSVFGILVCRKSQINIVNQKKRLDSVKYIWYFIQGEYHANEHFWNIIVRKYFYGKKLQTYFVIKVLRVKTAKCGEPTTLVVNLSTTRRARVRKVVYLRDKTKRQLPFEVFFLLVSIGCPKMISFIDNWFKILLQHRSERLLYFTFFKKIILRYCERNNSKPRPILWQRPPAYSGLIRLSR